MEFDEDNVKNIFLQFENRRGKQRKSEFANIENRGVFLLTPILIKKRGILRCLHAQRKKSFILTVLIFL